MKIMPFLVADEESVRFENPTLHFRGVEIEAGETAPTWDYMIPMKVLGSLSLDRERFLSSTGLESLDGVAAVLQVDCPATGYRKLDVQPVPDHQSGDVKLDVSIPEHEVAVKLVVTYSVLLSAPDGPVPANYSAHRKGSRLHSGSGKYVFLLEGEGGGFPVEAFNFEHLDKYPSDAAWVLEFRGDSLNEPFLGVTRLYVNTSHEHAQALLGEKQGLIHTVLKYDLISQMLGTVAAHWSSDGIEDFEPGSVGAVMNDQTNLYLGKDLSEAVDAIVNDRPRTLALLQEAVFFLKGDTR